MEELTAAKRKSLHMVGKLAGLRRARELIENADGMPKKAAENARKIIDAEIEKIMTLPEHHFE
jgi:hypothetical protein